MDVLDCREFRRVLGHYPTGVCVVTAMCESEPIGMVVGSFTSVSLEPALVAFLPDRRSTTWPRIRKAGHFCVNVLAHDQLVVCAAFSSKADNRFDSFPYRLSVLGSPIVEGSIGWIDCELDVVHESGDHYIVVGRVHQLDVERTEPPLIFIRGTYGTVSPCRTEETPYRSAA